MACSAAPMQIASLSGLVSIIAASHSVCQLKFRSDMAALPPEECRYLGLGRHFRHGKGGLLVLTTQPTSVSYHSRYNAKSSGVYYRRERPYPIRDHLYEQDYRGLLPDPIASVR